MRPAAVLLLCALPIAWSCQRERQQYPGGALDAEILDLARFEDAVRRTASARAHTAIALAAGSGRLTWGAADSAATVAEAEKLALSRCKAQVKLKRIDSPCKVYAVDGRPLYRERI